MRSYVIFSLVRLDLALLVGSVPLSIVFPPAVLIVKPMIFFLHLTSICLI